LRECYQSGPVFPIPQGTLPWQPIMEKMANQPPFGTLAF